jgi:hypothetical protein
MAKASSRTAPSKNTGAGASDSSLQELFLASLKDMYNAEKSLTKARQLLSYWLLLLQST